MLLRKLSYCIFLLATATCQAGAPIELGARLEPLVDDYLIAKLDGAALTLHEPVPREVSLTHDEPWEGNLSTYHTVFKDGNLYRMYYRGWKYDADTEPARFTESVTCYAESSDGINWTKPELGLFEFQGSSRNNIVWREGAATHNFSPFLDTNPACKPEQKYKALGGTTDSKGILAFQSGDGIHWSLMQTEPVITQGAFDSLNTAFWDATGKCYVVHQRGNREDCARDVLKTTSTDFIHWTDPIFLQYPGSPTQQLYTNSISPYYRAPHILFGFPMRYASVGWPPQAGSHLSPIMPANTDADHCVSDGLFMTSRDGLQFHRWSEALIRPGFQPERWATRTNMTAQGVVPTKSAITGAPNELSIYSTEGYFCDVPSRLRRYSIRMDGFVSVRANMNGGEMTTRLLTFAGKHLKINVSTSAAGSVLVEIQNAAGQPIPGFALDDCLEIFDDKIDRLVVWKSGSDVSKLVGQPIRLRFVMKDADIYALQFCEREILPSK